MDKSICKTNEYGYKHWYQNGKLHRIDGPAAEYADGGKHWYAHGIEYTEAEYRMYQLTKQLARIQERDDDSKN